MYEASLTQKEPKVDWILVGAIAGLFLLGLAFIFSASTANDPSSRLWIRQSIFYTLGLGIALGICFVPYETISRFATVGYWFAIALLIAVMFFGTTVFGAKRWIDLGFFRFQPSEFAKIAVIFMLASFLSRSQEELRAARAR